MSNARSGSCTSFNTTAGAVAAAVLTATLAFTPAASRAQAANPTTAQSAANAASATELQEVVVTAQFRPETVQATPISITAVTGDQLAQQGARRTSSTSRNRRPT